MCPSVFFVSHEQTSENEEKSVRVLGKNDWGDYFYFSAMIVYRDGIKWRNATHGLLCFFDDLQDLIFVIKFKIRGLPLDIRELNGYLLSKSGLDVYDHLIKVIVARQNNKILLYFHVLNDTIILTVIILLHFSELDSNQIIVNTSFLGYFYLFHGHLLFCKI